MRRGCHVMREGSCDEGGCHVMRRGCHMMREGVIRGKVSCDEERVSRDEGGCHMREGVM